MTVHRYRRDLVHPLNAQTIVYPYVLRTLRPSLDAGRLHALLHEAHAADGAHVPPRDAWLQALMADPAYDPGMVFLVETPHGILIAAAIAGTSGLVTDLAVAPSFRRLGIASVLLEHVCQVSQRKGLRTVELEIAAGNHAAIALVEAAGMRRVDELAMPAAAA